MSSNLVLSGGPGHDFDATTAALVDLLAAEGIGSTVVEHPDDLFTALDADPDRWDLVTVNALCWDMAAERFAALRDAWAYEVDPAGTAVIERHVLDGGSLLACHTAVLCFDADPAWRAVLGASWDWDRSQHPPSGPATLTVTAAGRAHPITTSTDQIRTVDEIYGFLDLDADVDALLTSPHGGVDHPVLWAREPGRGRVVVDLLGHDAAAMDDTSHAELVRRAARWLTHRDPTPAPERPT